MTTRPRLFSHLASTLITLVSLPLAVFAGEPSGPAFRVVDLTPFDENGDAFPVESRVGFDPVELDGRFYFKAYHPRSGVELWRSDGTPEGTELAGDLCPGACSSWPSDLRVYRGRLYFTADDGVLGRELFVASSGQAPSLLLDVCPGRCSGFWYDDPSSITVAMGRLFLGATDGILGHELRVLEGKRARLVADLCPGACDSHFRQLLPARGQLFFVEGHDYAGRPYRVYRTDGTSKGTVLLRDGRRAIVLGRRLLFEATTLGPPRSELWISDGTIAGTRKVSDLAGDFLGRFGGRIYFATEAAFYRTDGTAEGTRIFLDRRPVPGSSAVFATSGSAMFFQTQAEPGGGVELWTSDGTRKGSHVLLEDTFAAFELVAAGERIFFHDGRTLWTADTRSAEQVGAWDSAVLDLAAIGNRVFFTVHQDGVGRELWTSDGTPPGTGLVADIHQGAVSSDPTALAPIGERLVFAVRNGEVWSSDGTAAGTVALPHDLPIYPSEFFPWNGNLAYCSRFIARGSSLWTTDGTPAGTSEVAAGLTGCSSFVALADRFLFDGGIPDPVYFENDVELWTSDGSAAGTRRVADVDPTITGFVYPRPLSSAPAELTALDAHTALFTAGIAGHGRELWRTDATTNGTRRVRKLCPETRCDSDPRELVRLGDRILFSAHQPADGREPWVTDGTAAGTRRLASIHPGALGSDPHGLTVLRDKVVFFAHRRLGEALFETDGTPRGTRRIRNLAFGGQPSFAIEVVGTGERIFFTVYNRLSGVELWVSDGTGGGTRKVTDIAAGSRNAYPSGLTAVDGAVVFAADDGTHGLEPWVSDGTAEGTRMIQDIEPGPGFSSPAGFAVAGGLLYFRASTSESGAELWAVPVHDAFR